MSISFAANEIQRAFRGHLGRNKASSSLKNKYDNRQLSLFHYLCIQIQKSFRGYYSRKYKQSMRKRKRYCQRISEEGEKVRKMMEKYSEELIQVPILCYDIVFHLFYTIHTFFIFRKKSWKRRQRKKTNSNPWLKICIIS